MRLRDLRPGAAHGVATDVVFANRGAGAFEDAVLGQHLSDRLEIVCVEGGVEPAAARVIASVAAVASDGCCSSTGMARPFLGGFPTGGARSGLASA
jgi:hypothetical protein